MQLFIAKCVSQQTAVGEVMLKRAARQNCGFEVKTTLHVLRCLSPASRKVWKKGRKKLKKWLRDQKTDPAIIQALIYIVYRTSYGTILKRKTSTLTLPRVLRGGYKNVSMLNLTWDGQASSKECSRLTGQLHNNSTIKIFGADEQDIDGLWVFPHKSGVSYFPCGTT